MYLEFSPSLHIALILNMLEYCIEHCFLFFLLNNDTNFNQFVVLLG